MKVAVILPCYNEEGAIGKTVADFRAALPGADIYVYDNNSKDRTAAVAAEAGAIVRSEPMQGKGHVVRRQFADVEADVYVMADGDDTYEAGAAPAMIERLVAEKLDMVAGKRIETDSAAYRRGHRFGNWLLTSTVRFFFNSPFEDMLTGYRVMSRRFVKSVPFTARGFGIETELTIHMARMMSPVAEVPTNYKERPAGTVSKLNTYRDGWRILMTIGKLVRLERPLVFYGLIAIALVLASLLVAIPVFGEFVRTSRVQSVPSAVLSASLIVLATLSAMAGLILDAVTKGRWETKRLHYLGLPPP
ncbi:MAG: glycosyltransferase [Alphaproteobacteria bacterium]|nr:glycosyltransferase [Alphaproteobacteria bacterium]